MQTRNRPTYLLLIACTIVVGLASRKFSHFLPAWMAKNAGDALYAAMAFWLVGFLFPLVSATHAALAATLFCFSIEFLKFCQAPWLAAARQNPVGTLILGKGFHASNLVCYALGVALAAGVELLLRRRQV